MDKELAAAAVPADDDNRPAEGVGLAEERVKRAKAERNAQERHGLLMRRCVLAWRIGQMQRVELNDTEAAVAEWKRALAALDRFEKQDRPVDGHGLAFIRKRIVSDLTAAESDIAAAQPGRATLATLQRISGQMPLAVTDIQRMAKLLSSLPPTDPLPQLQPIFVLGPDRLEAKLMLDEPGTRKRSYAPLAHSDAPHWKYAFAPAPGKEFDSLEFTCDIEQLELRSGGHFRCSVTTSLGRPATLNLGGIGWPRDKPTGRDVMVKRFAIPPGVKVVFIETGSWKGKFNVHSVQVKATFRPVTVDAEPLLPRIDAWVETEVLPRGGTLTCRDEQLADETAYPHLKPGKYHLRYEAPGQRDNVFQTDLVAAPAGQYGIFANLDSPFTWTQSWVGRFSPCPPPRTTIVPLADGGYLAVWCSSSRKIMTCFSSDLADWAKPQPAPFNSVLSSIAPATIRTADGTVWLVFFSDRLQLKKVTSAGYRVWLTSTRDGRHWSGLKPVSVDGTIDGWPISAAHMLQASDGKCRIFWRNYAAQAESFADIRRLRPVDVKLGGDGPMHLWNPHVVADEQGLLHMVFDSFGMGIHYTTSDNGRTWALPVTLIPSQRNQQTTHPQLLMSKGKAALLYERNDGTFLAPVRLADNCARIGDTLKITNHVVPLSGSRMTVTPDGEVLLIAGNSATWLLRAKQDDILACTAALAGN